MSFAVGSELISKIVGYQIKKGDFQVKSPNLPQRIAILGEANTLNQAAQVFDEGVEITNAAQAGELFGWGSPMHSVARILYPVSGSGIGGIPTIFFPQAEVGGATARVLDIEATGVATANVTHTLVIAGRRGVDGGNYDFLINTGDTSADIHAKIADAINNVLGCPGTATSTDYEAQFTSKWKGLTAEDLDITVDTNENDAGINYSVSTVANAAGTPTVTTALETFDNDWNTVVVNTYGAVTSVMDELEAFNGIPKETTPTGRYAAIVMKPFFAFTGSNLEDPSSITDSRDQDVTIVMCPTPLSAGMPFEGAANYALLYGPQAQNTPNLDISGMTLPDMPTPESIGSMAKYLNRDAIVKKGCSTVELVSGLYKVVDFVTTYHPEGETPPQFRYVRSLTQDFNVRFRYFVQEQLFVVDHQIATDEQIVNATKVIKPSQWKQILYKLADNLSLDGIITEAQFMKDSIEVNIGSNNPDRFETTFSYKRSGFVRIASTTAEAGFNFND